MVLENGGTSTLRLTVLASLAAFFYVVSRLPSVSIEHTVFSGDSGNDIYNLKGDTKGIVVGNAHGKLFEAVKTNGEGNFKVILCKEGFARGIIEVLRTHGVL